MKPITTHSPAETEAFAQAMAARLRPGDVLALEGGMGAGKTAFVRGLARGLGAPGPVSSPTFALVHEYGGEPPLIHFDMYRITGPDDLESTGFFDYLDSGGVLAVEWSEHIADALPPGAIRVRLEPLGERERRITVTGLDVRATPHNSDMPDCAAKILSDKAKNAGNPRWIPEAFL